MINKDILNTLTNLNKLRNIKFPAKVIFAIVYNIKQLNLIAESIEEARMTIVRKYGIMQEDGTTYKIDKENIEQTQQELNDLLNIENDISLKKISIQDIENLDLSFEEMEWLYPMLEEA